MRSVRKTSLCDLTVDQKVALWELTERHPKWCSWQEINVPAKSLRALQVKKLAVGRGKDSRYRLNENGLRLGRSMSRCPR